LRQFVAGKNGVRLREYRERWSERTDVKVCLAMICEALKYLKLLKVAALALQMSDPAPAQTETAQQNRGNP
jgi:hypothetical protein